MQLRLPQPTDVRGKTVLVRVAFDVPMKQVGGKWMVEDDQRIRASLPTIQFLLENQAKIVLISHLGRPESHFEAKYSMAPVSFHLKELLQTNIQVLSHCVGESVEFHVKHLQPGDVLLLENLRFNPEEEENDVEFAQDLARLADVYINDAFSVAHRAHASVAAVTQFIPSFAGFALAKEVEELSRVRDNPQRPLVVVIGGAKISDKVDAIVSLAHKADVVLTGGGVANNFLKAEGLEIHKSYLQDAPVDLKKKGVDYVHVAKDLLQDARTSHVWMHNYVPVPKILYPLDVVAASSMESHEAEIITIDPSMVDTPNDKDLMYLDIGPKTVKLYQELIATAGTVFWNGPMGVFEQPQFSDGTKQIAQAIAGVTGQAETIIGGGDTISAIDQFGLGDKYSYVSTAGGASLEFLAGKKLPGLEPLIVSNAVVPRVVPGALRSTIVPKINTEHKTIDELVWLAHFGTESEQKAAHQTIRARAENQGARPSSIYDIYAARGRGEVPHWFTVPAFNLRGLSYLTAQAAFEAAKELNVGLVLFELARSEMKYTDQTPAQLVSSVLAAAIKTGWKHLVFIQGDHYQPKAEAPGQIAEGETEKVKQLIIDSISAGIYNIDIDGSTLVNTKHDDEYEQQRPNYIFTAEMIRWIKQVQPQGMRVNTGCEISEVGTHLSKSSQLSAFMTGLHLEGHIAPADYPTKVAIETGTAHGGKVNPDGSQAEMHVDFERLKTISVIARHKYQMAGAVQHGASTLSAANFSQFPEAEAAEIHLSTGFQNTIMDHPAFPHDLKHEIYEWCRQNLAAERKAGWTDQQFFMKLRKKAWGPFKKQVWSMSPAIQQAIKQTLAKECRMYYENLRVMDTQKFVIKQ